MPLPLKPESTDLSPAYILLRHIPSTVQSKLLRSLVASLGPCDTSAVDFVATLVEQSRDEPTKEELLAFLERTIESGDPECAISTSLQHPLLGKQLLNRAASILAKARSLEAEDLHDHASVQAFLSFSRSTLSQLPIGDAHTVLFEACLGLMESGGEEISSSARQVVFTFMSTSNEQINTNILLPCQASIWQSIRLGAASILKSQTLSGYSLWLRWLLSVPAPQMKHMITEEYWELILQGLRKGDAERRKICLSILKLSVAADDNTSTSNVHAQFDRYCTVFETIVLGRYINQIQECEDDLSFLAADSDLDPRWFYVLLASALDGRMQDSNRKFIGNWVMRSNFRASPNLLSFFEHDFLPWAVQGQHFVSTLRRHRAEMRCQHGDRLADVVRTLLQSTADSHELANVIVDTIAHRRNTLFAYAIVYLLEGLGERLCDTHVSRVSALNGLPEVARAYVSKRVSDMSTGVETPKKPSRRALLEEAAIADCHKDPSTFDKLDDVWSDLDYLEYPKSLLLDIPHFFFQGKVLQHATQDAAFASKLQERFRILQDVGETKIFLFAPLVSAIRIAYLTEPATAEVLDIAGFITRIAERPPEPTIDLMLEEATIHLTPFSYEHYFGDPASYGFAAYIDLVSRLSDEQQLVQAIIDHILARWKNQKVPPPTVSAWKTTLQLQALLLCLEQYTPTSAAAVHALLEELFHILAIEPLPRYRYLLEWMVVRIFMKHDLQDDLLVRLATPDHHSNPKHLASLMKIGVVLACTRDSEEKFALQLATAFVPLAASSKVVIRHEGQWQMPLLMDHARAQGWSSITDNPAFSALDGYIRSLERFHEPPPERVIGRFDPDVHHTLTNLVQGLWFDLDHTESPLTNRNDLLKLYKSDEPRDLPGCCMPLGNAIEQTAVKQDDEQDAINTKASVGPRTVDEAAALQTKGTAYLARTLSDPNDQQARPSKVIVIGSLVDNPYNLGGLSRVSEIFGASALCLQNQNVVSNKDFTSVAVSSHLHFPIVQLSAPGIPAFLAERKAEGFAVLGIEQTDRSVILGSTEANLPEKVVLVVGSEKEGIPALVLTECDVLVEIPQQGITRSLNVQTAVSIVLYEHARQHAKTM